MVNLSDQGPESHAIDRAPTRLWLRNDLRKEDRDHCRPAKLTHKQRKRFHGRFLNPLIWLPRTMQRKEWCLGLLPSSGWLSKKTTISFISFLRCHQSKLGRLVYRNSLLRVGTETTWQWLTVRPASCVKQEAFKTISGLLRLPFQRYVPRKHNVSFIGKTSIPVHKDVNVSTGVQGVQRCREKAGGLRQDHSKEQIL